MARLGRKSKLTPARAEAIAQYISAGLLDKNAARLAGIGVRTFYYWLSKAEEENAEPKYVQFREAMELARINFEHHHLQIIAQAGHNGDWRASAFILERRFP
ncbi:MAG: hypothetical protein OXG15_10245, partial [Gammaproteobacteria bacterium]|nr:hypothetical protein [Gammaproteobacteria bacterium]